MSNLKSLKGTYRNNHCTISNMSKISLKEIYKYGDGFNIEAGDLSRFLLPGQKWMNMCMILDRPFIDGKTLAEITKDNTFPLKEMSILEYDEFKVNMAIMLIINYFMNQKDEKLLIQIHRESSGLKQIKIISDMITDLWKEDIVNTNDSFNYRIFIFSNGFVLKLINGYTPDKLRSHPDFTTIFSLSLMGGLNPKWKSGTITLPSVFIPFDTTNNIINIDKTFKVNNYLIEILDYVLQTSFDEKKLFNIVRRFSCQNSYKRIKMTNLMKYNFLHHNVTVFQIDKLYDPKESDFNNPVTIINCQAKL